MKDYSKVKYVKPSVDGLDITKGKVYRIVREYDLHYIIDDSFDEIGINIPMCCHLKFKHWIPCDENGKEIEL